MLHFSKALIAAALFALSVTPAAAQDDAAPLAEQAEQASQPAIALMGTIPIYWGEAAGFDEMLSGGATSHWAREVLERRAALAPLDYLSQDALAPHRNLLLAQPRGLSGEENVALDAWVREGGRLLLFADPWMTGESRFHIGDRRRPQDVTLLSPILAHWGLELDTSHDNGLEFIAQGDAMLPVDTAGVFTALADAENDYCELAIEGLLASCRIGEGRVLIMADAAILDLSGPYPQAKTGLESLLAQIFPDLREDAGIGAESWEAPGESDGNLPNITVGDIVEHGHIGDKSTQ